MTNILHIYVPTPHGECFMYHIHVVINVIKNYTHTLNQCQFPNFNTELQVHKMQYCITVTYEETNTANREETICTNVTIFNEP